MTQHLATLNAGSRPLDFGLTIAFDAEHGMRAEGRPDSHGYVGPWFEGVSQGDVTLSDVADDYAFPSNLPVPGLWDNKDHVTPDQFPGLVLKAFKTLYLPQGWTNEQVADRIDRLWNDRRATTIRQVLESPTLEHIDPNDRTGNFKAMLNELKTVKAASDNLVLMTASEEAAIAATFPLIKGA